ncbi:MAG TPA: MupA/Atu3671 family FMN-dependent luciferase-like monooxygenase, partial [Gemmatimonadaceae bacterium]|nr:MupA/Atu3671 family FMN-dependent luciferase-like monooxygenase [Gemmatimonadaceae bacterium]
WTGAQPLIAERATSLALSDVQAASPAGTLVGIGGDSLTIRVSDGLVRLDGVRAADGTAIDVAAALTRAGLGEGTVLPSIDPHWLAEHDCVVRPAVVRERGWVDRLASIDPLPAPGVTAAPDAATHRDALREPADVSWTGTLDSAAPDSAHARERLIALIALFVARHGMRADGDVGIGTAARIADAKTAPLLASVVPLRVVAGAHSVADALAAQVDRVRALETQGTFLSTVHVRYPQLAALPAASRRLAVCIADGVVPDHVDAALLIAVGTDGRTIQWRTTRGAGEVPDLERLHRRLETFVRAALADPSQPVSQVALVDVQERALLAEWGCGPDADIDASDTIHAQVARQAARTPDHVALVAGDVTLTYAELLTRVDHLARQLAGHGVRPDSRVALLCSRTVDLVIGMLAILRAGGAYVPLDPAYPADRVRLMLDDCGATVVVTQRDLVGSPALDGAVHARSLVIVDDVPAADVAQRSTRDPMTATVPGSDATGANLAYVIYTSGSTGRPKGVMVEHRQVVNFFRGMDDVLGTSPGVWLAVTSMSFDISVLELLWTLTRGYTVVVAGASTASSPVRRAAARDVGFSLFYFSADEQEQGRDKYRLLMEGARFADTHGFEAVWTPERHLHAFGGLYPNPSVTSAALAAITTRVAIRAGSCVLPLHHPARVAEEWSVVDNLSNGRVGISFAAGWQPNDFVFRPENYADAKQSMFRDIELVQRLWRGETLPFPGPRGDVEVRTLPRPVQPELPTWITTAGNPETFEQAGRFGGHLLTHLLGQSVEELSVKIAAYRAAWRAAGHAGEGRITLMLHTFVGDSDAQVREIVREPMTAYLRTSVGLIKQYAGVFPTLRRRPGSDGSDIDFTALTPEEMDALLEFSFERYYQTSALFGSVETAAAMVDKVRAIGVDELACLVDFGLDTSTVLAHLPQLDALRVHCSGEPTAPAVSVAAAAAARTDDESLSALVARHAVTHFQCTPSMARLLLAASDTRDALRHLDVMCVGGEALSPALATELHAVLRGRLCNMYGPTETTIWSSVQEVKAGEAVSLGRPIVNTTLQVVDPATRALLPVGTPGELLIGGAGVVRGYLDRADLTAERFVDTTDIRGSVARVYRTGDLAQWDTNGALQFLGRIDHQVKVRGYRIELGEIEAVIAGDESVQEVVVLAREEEIGDPRLVAYVTARPGATVAPDALRTRLQAALPEFMVPSQYVVLADMPRTPNLKIDRKALPAPSAVAATAAEPAAAPENDLERTIAGVWCEVLRVPAVGSRDNFFDLGGHSLLVVQVHQRLTTALQLSFPITDLFRFPTVRAIAGHLAQRRAPATDAAAVRGASPRDDISRRAELRRTAAQRHVRPRS